MKVCLKADDRKKMLKALCLVLVISLAFFAFTEAVFAASLIATSF